MPLTPIEDILVDGQNVDKADLRDFLAAGGVFTQSGTGAVPRTVQAKARDIVSVKDFGAVCDNSTDDTTAWGLAIAAAFAAGVALYHPGGLSKITAALDATADYGITIYGVGHNAGPTYDNVVSGIVQYTANTPILQIQGQSNRLENLYLAYNSQQTTGNTSSTALQLNNVSGSSFRNLKFYRANTSIGIPQSAFGATSYNAVWDSIFENILSYEASLTHLDFRNFSGGGTNTTFDKLYLNGGGSLDFVTPGQSVSYGIRMANCDGYNIQDLAIEGQEVNERLIDVASGTNRFIVDQFRTEGVNIKKDNDGWIGLGGAFNDAKFRTVNFQNTKWTPAAPTAMYLFRTNATINILSVDQYTVAADCDFGASGVRRLLTNSCTDFVNSDIVINGYDPDPQLSDTIWTDGVTTRQSPVRQINWRVNYDKVRNGRTTATHVVYYGFAAPVAADGTFGAGDRWVMNNPTVGTVAEYIFTTAGAIGGAAVIRPSVWTVGRGTTAQRPTLTANDVGVQYLDNTIAAAGSSIWWNGTAWVNAAGTAV
jgi:hypothetical protein